MTELLIRRRIGTAMLFLALFITGLLALVRIPVELLPGISMPVLTVLTSLENAPPGEVEKLVTARIEESVSAVTGVTGIFSRSVEGLSIVKVRFCWGRDMDMALIETKEKADLVRGQLPDDAGKTMVVKYDPSDEPVMIYAVSTDGEKKGCIRRRAEKEIVPRLERIGGVALADLSGGDVREISVEADVQRLYSHGISFGEICEAIAGANCSYPAGTLTEGEREYLVRTEGLFSDPSEIESVPVAYSESGLPVRVKDLARVKDGFRERSSSVRFNSEERVALLVRREPGKNTIETCKGVRREMERISSCGKGLKAECVFDQSRFIKSAVNSVFYSAIAGAVIACLVLRIFLGTAGPSLIIAASIPVSVAGTFLLMYLYGITLNTMSLGGLALGTGMMVDAGIVVLESIGTACGKDQAERALRGTRDVIGPVTVSILTSVIVFLPIIFLSGLSGALFRELAMTVSFALLFSLFTSIALVPMLAGLPGGIISAGKTSGLMNRVEEVYEKVIRKALNAKGPVISMGLLSFLAGAGLFLFTDREIMPRLDPGEFVMELELPAGTSLDNTSRACASVERYLLSMDGVKNVFTRAGSDPDDSISEKISGRKSSDAELRIFMKEGESARKCIAFLRQNFRPGGNIFLRCRIRQDIVSEMISGPEGILVVEIRGTARELLERKARELKDKLSGVEGVNSVRPGSGNMTPGLSVDIDRARAAAMGLSMEGIARALSSALKGEVATLFRQEDQETGVRVRARRADRRENGDLGKIPVKTADGDLVPLHSLGTVKKIRSCSSLYRREQAGVETVMIYCEEEGSFSAQDLKPFLEKISSEGAEPVLLSGEGEIARTLSDLLFAMALAVVFIYMLLASQFQSLKNPLVVMLSIPATAGGVSLSLLLTGQTLNINSGMGIIMLCGIVVNNAIVLFDAIEKGIRQSLPLEEAVVSAGKRRLRPIMMTTLTTVLALLPMALGITEGSGLQRPLAVTVMGGLLFSTMLTLVFMPVVYVMVNAGREGKA